LCPDLPGYVLDAGHRPDRVEYRMTRVQKAASIKAIAAACDQQPRCLAFTPDGWLYRVSARSLRPVARPASAAMADARLAHPSAGPLGVGLGDSHDCWRPQTSDAPGSNSLQ
jgi:hypothetical protein